MLLKLFNNDHHDQTYVDLFQMKIDWLKREERHIVNVYYYEIFVLTFLKIISDCYFDLNII